jgi:hypothetical protein
MIALNIYIAFTIAVNSFFICNPNKKIEEFSPLFNPLNLPQSGMAQAMLCGQLSENKPPVLAF